MNDMLKPDTQGGNGKEPAAAEKAERKAKVKEPLVETHYIR